MFTFTYTRTYPSSYACTSHLAHSRTDASLVPACIFRIHSAHSRRPNLSVSLLLRSSPPFPRRSERGRALVAA
eukprot:6176779-Pleurochrysis_carterae.AAC.2